MHRNGFQKAHGAIANKIKATKTNFNKRIFCVVSNVHKIVINQRHKALNNAGVNYNFHVTKEI